MDARPRNALHRAQLAGAAPASSLSKEIPRLLTFSISRMTIIKTSTSYFACASPATTAATLSSIWIQPSI